LRAQVLDYPRPVLVDDGLDERGIGTFCERPTTKLAKEPVRRPLAIVLNEIAAPTPHEPRDEGTRDHRIEDGPDVERQEQDKEIFQDYHGISIAYGSVVVQRLFWALSGE